MTCIRAIHMNGNSHALKVHFTDRPNTTVDADRYTSRIPTLNIKGIVYPDLLIAFNTDPNALERSNAYVISEQGKPPDFILEIASQKTRTFDRATKRDIYAGLKIPEYWRFDETGEYHKTKLAGDRLVEGHYEPVTIDTLPDGRLRGYSTVLNLILEWHNGQLNWRSTPIPRSTFPPSNRNGRAAWPNGRPGLQAEARAGALEAELRRLRGE